MFDLWEGNFTDFCGDHASTCNTSIIFSFPDLYLMLMFPTTATIRAAKRDRVAGGQQQVPTGTATLLLQYVSR
jgi:hypothetical protein